MCHVIHSYYMQEEMLDVPCEERATGRASEWTSTASWPPQDKNCEVRICKESEHKNVVKKKKGGGREAGGPGGGCRYPGSGSRKTKEGRVPLGGDGQEGSHAWAH